MWCILYTSGRSCDRHVMHTIYQWWVMWSSCEVSGGSCDSHVMHTIYQWWVMWSSCDAYYIPVVGHVIVMWCILYTSGESCESCDAVTLRWWVTIRQMCPCMGISWAKIGRNLVCSIYRHDIEMTSLPFQLEIFPWDVGLSKDDTEWDFPRTIKDMDNAYTFSDKRSPDSRDDQEVETVNYPSACDKQDVLVRIAISVLWPQWHHCPNSMLCVSLDIYTGSEDYNMGSWTVCSCGHWTMLP